MATTAMHGSLAAPIALSWESGRVPEWTFSAIQAGFWMSFCVSVSFAAVYLQALGYSNGALGLILALGNLLGVAVSLGLSAWIDRAATITAARLIPVVLALQAASVLALLASPVEGPLTSVAFVAYIGFCTVVNALNLKLYADADHIGHRMNYSFTRGMGSVAYVLASVALGFLVGSVSHLVVPQLGLALCVLQYLAFRLFSRFVEEGEKAAPGAAAACVVGSGVAGTGATTAGATSSADAASVDATLGAQRSTDAASASTRSADTAPDECCGSSTLAFIRENAHFCVMLLGVALLYFGHSTACNFLINLVRRAGGDTADMGIITGFKGLVEIPTMFLYAQLFRGRSHALAIRIAALAFVLKTIAFIASGTVLELGAAFVLQAPSYALFMAAIVPYVQETIRFADSAKAQSLAFNTTVIGGMLANLIAGQLYDFFSVTVVLCIALVVGVVGAAVTFVGTRS